MIQLDSTEARNFAVHLEGYEGLGGELVKNGNFSEIGSDLVTNGDFSDVPLGSELVVNGDFLSASSWNVNSNWNINTALGVAEADGTSDKDINQSVWLPVIGKSYKVTFEVVSRSQGDVLFTLGGVTGQTHNTLGIKTEYIVATSISRLKIDSQSSFIGSVTNVSIKEVINLVSNPNFTDTAADEVTYPNFTNSDLAQWKIANSRATKSWDASEFMRLTYDLAEGQALYAVFGAATVNASYKVTMRVRGTKADGTTAQGSSFYRIGDNSSIPATGIVSNPTLTSEWQDYEFYIVPTTTTFRFYLQSAAIGDLVDFDSISVKELGADWTIINSGTASTYFGENKVQLVTSGDYTDVTQLQTIDINTSYKYSFEIVDFFNGSAIFQIGGATVATETGNGVYSGYYTSPTGNDHMLFKRDGACDLGITNISVQELGEGWDFNAVNATNTISIESGGARVISVETNISLRQTILEVGKHYKLTCDTAITSGALGLDSYTAGTTTNFTEGANVVYFTAASTLFIIKRITGDDNVLIDNISVQELDPNGYWNTNPNWLLEQGQAVSDGTNVGSLNQAGVTTLGKTYVAKYDILSYTSGAGFMQRVGSGSVYSDAETSIATHSTTQIATGNDYIYVNPQNTIGSITNISVRLKNTGVVTLTLTNQLTEKVTTVELTPIVTNGRYSEFSYQPTDLIEGMYLIKFTGDSTTYAETLAYITTGTPPLGESNYKAYTTGDDNPDHVYIP